MHTEKTDEPFWSAGLRFECTSCGHCCRHEPGYVFLSKKDLAALARHKGMSPRRFAAEYCRTVDLGIARRLSLLETPEHDCVFWDGGCTVYGARPLQCRTYPFWPAVLASPEDWEREGRDCPGIGRGELRTADEIAEALRARERDALISPSR